MHVKRMMKQMKVPRFNIMNINVMHVFMFIIFFYITSNLLQIYRSVIYVNILIIKLERFLSSQKSCDRKNITNLSIL